MFQVPQNVMFTVEEQRLESSSDPAGRVVEEHALSTGDYIDHANSTDDRHGQSGGQQGGGSVAVLGIPAPHDKPYARDRA